MNLKDQIGYATAILTTGAQVASTWQSVQSMEDQKRELELRANQLWAEGKQQEYLYAKGLLEQGKIKELAMYFLAQDVKRALFYGAIVIGGWLIYRKVSK